jgi:c-di-GMP-binding flagellar brake protein YcgR
MPDGRKFPRLNEGWQLAYRILEKEKALKEPLRNFTVDISGGGICFLSKEELAPKTPLAIELDSEEFPSPIMALAHVVWCNTTEQEYEVGA